MGEKEFQPISNEATIVADEGIPNYKVLFLNDDFTPMDFVVDVLINVFHKSLSTAKALMLKIHAEGEGVVGVYHKEIAETKVKQTLTAARRNNFPLKVFLEKE